MKKLFLSLGLSVTLLLSAAFAQETIRKTALDKEQASIMNLFARTKKFLPLAKFKRVKKVNLNAATVKNQPTLRYQACYKSPKNTGKATIKLINDVYFEDGSGCQMLLDNRHQLVDEYLDYTNDREITQDMIDAMYGSVTASIPQNATPVLGTTSIMPGESDSIMVDPGTYDALAVYPSALEDNLESGSTNIYIYLAGWETGFWDDITLEADYTYVFQTTVVDYEDDIVFIPPFAIKVENLELPVVSCQTSEVEVSLIMTNEGNQTIENCKAFYVYRGLEDESDELDTVKETVRFPNGGLKTGQIYKFTFTEKIELTQDTSYTIVGGVYPIDKEIETSDNYIEDLLVKKSSVNVPYEFKIEENDLTFRAETWETGLIVMDEDTIFGIGSYEPEYPAVTRCISMEANQTYRLSLDGKPGSLSIFGTHLNASYGIKFGKVTEDLSKWQVVHFEEDVYLNDIEPISISVTPSESGDYAFCFYEDYSSMGGGIILANIRVTKVLEKDVKLTSFYGLPSMMPAEHANHTHSASFNLVNWGVKDIEKVILKVALNGQEISSKEIAVGKADTVQKGTIDLPATGLATGMNAVFTATLEFPGDEDLSNNTQSWTFEVTNEVMAYDFVTDEMYENPDNYSIGSSVPLGCGVPFLIEQEDTMTGIVLGFSEVEEDMPIGITIHQWNPTTETLGNLLYETTVRRGVEAGAHKYVISSLILEPGNYMISAIQLDKEFLGLMADRKKTGMTYITTLNPVVKQPGLGTPMVRAVFGHDGKPKSKDIAVTEITKIKATGRYAENQEVAAIVINQGYEEAKDVSVSFMVNGTLVSKKTVNFASYGRQEVNFTADLSALSTEYILTVFAVMEGDEDPTNDTCVKTVHSITPANPYIMNFEECEDFAIDDFNPEWLTIDLDGSNTYGFQGLNFPHSGEPFAFIAFNPEELGVPAETMSAHNGYRMGASFASINGLNDDWLISPKLKIVEGLEYMNFFVKTFSDKFELEQYNVLVSMTNDNRPESGSFTKIGETREAPFEDWEEVSIDLKEYSGKEVYLAIQCVSEEGFIFMIDDITVCSGNVANESAANVESRLSVYPNPAHEMITIHAQDALIKRVTVFNVTGMMVYQSKHLNTIDYRYNVKALNPSIYFARVTTDKGIAVIKFVVGD